MPYLPDPIAEAYNALSRRQTDAEVRVETISKDLSETRLEQDDLRTIVKMIEELLPSYVQAVNELESQFMRLSSQVDLLEQSQDGHHDCLIEHTERMNRQSKLLDQFNVRIMNMEEDKFNRDNRIGEDARSLISKNAEAGRQASIANDVLNDFAEWLLSNGFLNSRAGVIWNKPLKLIGAYDSDHEWHDRNETYEEYGD